MDPRECQGEEWGQVGAGPAEQLGKGLAQRQQAGQEPITLVASTAAEAACTSLLSLHPHASGPGQ